MNYRSPSGKTVYVAFFNNADYPNRFSFDGNPSTSKFWPISLLYSSRHKIQVHKIQSSNRIKVLHISLDMQIS